MNLLHDPVFQRGFGNGVGLGLQTAAISAVATILAIVVGLDPSSFIIGFGCGAIGLLTLVLGRIVL